MEPEHNAKGNRKSFTKINNLSRGSVQVLQDIFHLFERSDNVILDGRELAAAMVENGISLADSEVDSTLSILNNHDDSMDIYEFCYLVVSAVKHLLAIRDDIQSAKPILAALTKFLIVSAVNSIPKREVWTRKSADTLGFYFEGARLAGLTEKQLAIRACSLDTSGSSPYKQPVVLPGLPAGDGSMGTSKMTFLSPCTIVPPRPSEVGGKRLSKCTILPYEGGLASMTEGQRRRTVPFQSVAKPAVLNKRATFTLGPYASQLAFGDVIKKGDKQDGSEAQKKMDAQSKTWKELELKPRPRGRPLPFKLPDFPNCRGKMITFAELTKVRDEMMLARRDHRLTMGQFAARRIVDSIPSEQFRKQFKHTIKAYFG